MIVSNPSWAVVATVDEPPCVVQAFVAWHLAQGASQVFVYCDRADDPVVRLINDLPGVSATLCDARYWENAHCPRPGRVEERQVHNATDAYARCDVDWLIHLDADEFLWAEQPIGQALQGAKPEVDGLVVPVAERVHLSDDPGLSIYEGAFRRPFHGTNKDGRALFGREYHLTYKGLSSHAQGKTFMRTGRDLVPSIHRAKAAIDGKEVLHHRLSHDQLELLHFEGLTSLHWIRKLKRLRTQTNATLLRHRQRQLDAFATEDAGLYTRLKTPAPKVIDALRKHALLAEPDFDPTAAVHSVFGSGLYFQPPTLDRWVAERNNPDTA